MTQVLHSAKLDTALRRYDGTVAVEGVLLSIHSPSFIALAKKKGWQPQADVAVVKVPLLSGPAKIKFSWVVTKENEFQHQLNFELCTLYSVKNIASVFFEKMRLRGA